MGEHFSEIFNKDDNSVGSKQEMRNVEEENSENGTEVNLDSPTKIEIEVSLVTVKEWKSSRFR